MKGSLETKTAVNISQDQKKLPKSQTSPPSDETNVGEVLIKRMKQHNWTLLIACKICKKCPELDPIYITSISYGGAIDGQKYTMLFRKSHSQNWDFSSQMSLIRLNFQNNHGNPSSGEP